MSFETIELKMAAVFAKLSIVIQQFPPETFKKFP